MKRLLRILKWIAIVLVVIFIGIQFLSTGAYKSGDRSRANYRSADADAASGRVNLRSLVSRLSLTQNGVARGTRTSRPFRGGSSIM
jgi:hypothetical protein